MTRTGDTIYIFVKKMPSKINYLANCQQHIFINEIVFGLKFVENIKLCVSLPRICHCTALFSRPAGIRTVSPDFVLCFLRLPACLPVAAWSYHAAPGCV